MGMYISYYHGNGEDQFGAVCIGRVSYNTMFWNGKKPPIKTGHGFYQLGPESCGWKPVLVNPWIIQEGMSDQVLLDAAKECYEFNANDYITDILELHISIIQAFHNMSFNPSYSKPVTLTKRKGIAAAYYYFVWQTHTRGVEINLSALRITTMYHSMVAKGLDLNTPDFRTNVYEEGPFGGPKVKRTTITTNDKYAINVVNCLGQVQLISWQDDKILLLEKQLSHVVNKK